MGVPTFAPGARHVLLFQTPVKYDEQPSRNMFECSALPETGHEQLRTQSEGIENSRVPRRVITEQSFRNAHTRLRPLNRIHLFWDTTRPKARDPKTIRIACNCKTKIPSITKSTTRTRATATSYHGP